MDATKALWPNTRHIPAADPNLPRGGIQVWGPAIFGIASLAHILATRASWSAIPLQTDTGMWAYIGGRILEGALPYRDLWESKPPGVYYVFALVEYLFGVGQDRAFLWLDGLLSLAILAVTYIVARSLASRLAAAAAVFLASLVLCHRALADWGVNVEKFTALFEMLACYAVLRAPRERRRALFWLAAGLSCGFAMLFKQTGILFAVAAALTLLLSSRETGDPSRPTASRAIDRKTASPSAAAGCCSMSRATRMALLLGGMALVWLPVADWMRARGILHPFFQQAILYDLWRVGSAEAERSRLASSEHWSAVADSLKLTLVLSGPALLAVLYWLRSTRPASGAGGRQATAALPQNVLLVVLYWLLTSLVFPLAPHGYGHYLLQAAPPAAVLAAWLFHRAWQAPRDRYWVVAAALGVALGLWPLADHFRFTFDRASQYRLAYEVHTQETRALVDTLRSHTDPDQSVMLWPPDYAVSYYAHRRTPLEVSNSDVIFKGKIGRLSPPLPELLDRLKTSPPSVIADWTPALVQLPPADAVDQEPHLLVSAAGFSLAEDPNDRHPAMEGRLLAPLKRWVQEQYGGQRRIDPYTLYFRGQPWRSWPEVLLRQDGKPPPTWEKSPSTSPGGVQ